MVPNSAQPTNKCIRKKNKEGRKWGMERRREGRRKHKAFKGPEKNVSGWSMECLRDGEWQLVNSTHQGLLISCWLVSL